MQFTCADVLFFENVSVLVIVLPIVFTIVIATLVTIPMAFVYFQVMLQHEHHNCLSHKLIHLPCIQRRKKTGRYETHSTGPFIPIFHQVDDDCNMIDYAKKIVRHYDPDSGKGYYQLTDTAEEYISHNTDVILISEV